MTVFSQTPEGRFSVIDPLLLEPFGAVHTGRLPLKEKALEDTYARDEMYCPFDGRGSEQLSDI